MMEDMKPATGPDMPKQNCTCLKPDDPYFPYSIDGCPVHGKKAPTMPQETWSEFAEGPEEIEGPLLRSEVELLKARVAGGETAMIAVAVTVKRLTAERDTALAENAWRLVSEEFPPAGPADGDSPRIIVWIADGGLDGKGLAAWGYAYVSPTGYRLVRAEGYMGNWQITHWKPAPVGPGGKA